MQQTYSARYSDQFGDEEILIHNDGRELRMVIRGLNFKSHDFFTIELSEVEKSRLHPAFSSFLFNGTELCSCTLECDYPIFILLDQQTQPAQLHIHIEVGPPSHVWNLKIRLQLTFGDASLESRLIEDSFEEALLDLISLLPANVHLQCCFACAFSDYSPYGTGAFGDMRCHRNNKSQYLAVRSKADYFKVPVTEIVQETYLCPEFETRIKGTGYRG